MQKQDKNRSKGMSREQRIKQKADLELPVNKFLNAVEEGTNKIKFPIAVKLRQYWMFNPGPILIDMRLSNGYLHEIRWRLELAENHLAKHKEDENSTFVEMDGFGNKIVKKHYGGYISNKQTVHTVLSKLRNHLMDELLAKCDNDFFTLDQYNDFVLKTEKIVADLGYELFPAEVKLIEPL